MEISQELQDRMKAFELDSKRKFHDFQIVGKVISDFVGKPAYFLFSRYEHSKIKQAFWIAEKKGIQDLNYLVGIIKKL